MAQQWSPTKVVTGYKNREALDKGVKDMFLQGYDLVEIKDQNRFIVTYERVESPSRSPRPIESGLGQWLADLERKLDLVTADFQRKLDLKAEVYFAPECEPAAAVAVEQAEDL